MNRHLFLLTALAVTTFLFLGSCDTENLIGPGSDVTRAVYRRPDTPEHVVTNLVAAYRNRDIDAYSQLFAPEFTFRFQRGDVEAVGRDSWKREEEIASARRLFESAEVCDLCLDLEWEPAVTTAEQGLEHTKLVRTTRMLLEVVECAGASYRVDSDVQYFFLRRDYVTPSRGWMIVEWWDTPGTRE